MKLHIEIIDAPAYTGVYVGPKGKFCCDEFEEALEINERSSQNQALAAIIYKMPFKFCPYCLKPIKYAGGK